MKLIFVMLSLAVAFGVGVAVGSGKSNKSSYESPYVAPQLATVMTYVEYKDSICKDIEAGRNVCGLKK